MNNKLHRLGIIWLSLIVSLVLYQYYVVLASPQVPYMDTMLYIVQIDQILKGEVSWLDVYGSGEHRGLIYPFVTFIEWAFWGVDARISTRLTGFVLVATFFYWLSAFLSVRPGVAIENKKVAIVVCLVAAVIVVSPAGFELWTLDLGFAQILKNFLIVTFLYLLAVKRSWAKTSISAITFGICGGFLILFATYGWSYPFFIASSFALIISAIGAPGTRKQALIVIVVMLLAQALYVYNGQGVFSTNKPGAADGVSLLGLISGILYGAGTVFIGSETMQRFSLPVAVPLMLGVLVLVAAFLALLIALVERTREKIFLSGLLMFSLTVLAGVAVARGFPDFTNTGASRYFVDYVWLLLAPLAIVFTAQESILARNIPHKLLNAISLKKLVAITRIFVMALLLAAMSGHLATWYVELQTAPFRATLFKGMAEVYRNGVASESDAALLQSPFSVARRAIAVAQSYNLSVLRNDPGQCTLTTAGYRGDWYPAEENDMRWLKKQGTISFDQCLTDVIIKGFIPESFSARNLLVTYGEINQSIAIVPGEEFLFVVNVGDKETVMIGLQLEATTTPASAGINADTRELGLLLTYIGKSNF